MAEDVLELIRRHGWSATSFQILEPGYRYWFGDDACVAYVDTGRAWVAAGPPIAAQAALADVTAAFMRAAREAGRKAVFFGVEAGFVAASGLPSFKVGEQPTWDPVAWSDGVRASRSIREQLRRARSQGVTVRAVTSGEIRPGAPLRVAIDGLVKRWLASRAMAPMGFLVDVEPYGFAEERRYWVAERAGVLVGLAIAVPVYGRDGWHIEDLLRAPDAPKGTNVMLVDQAMRAFAREGSRYVTLGMVPLAGVDRWLAKVRDASRTLYDFAGLDTFKSRLRPHRRDDVLVAHAPNMRPLFAIQAVLTAFARGSLVRFGVATVTRGGPVALRTLAALLVPWTILVAFASARWFPSTTVKLGWIALDGAIVVGLFALAARYRASLGLGVALAVSVDVVLTIVQAITWNWPRQAHASDAFIIAIACLAPALGAVVTWGAYRRMRTLSGP